MLGSLRKPGDFVIGFGKPSYSADPGADRERAPLGHREMPTKRDDQLPAETPAQGRAGVKAGEVATACYKPIRLGSSKQRTISSL